MLEKFPKVTQLKKMAELRFILSFNLFSSRVRKLWLVGGTPLASILVKSSIVTTGLIHLPTACCCFLPAIAGWVLAAEPKIFTVWPIHRKSVQPPLLSFVFQIPSFENHTVFPVPI